MQTLRLNRYFNWTLISLGKASKNLGLFYTITLPFYFAITFVFYYIFGVRIPDFYNFTQACLAMFRMIIGIQDTRMLFTVNKLFTVFMSILTNSYFFFLVTPLSVAFLVDSFRQTIIEEGYPFDKEAMTFNDYK